MWEHIFLFEGIVANILCFTCREVPGWLWFHSIQWSGSIPFSASSNIGNYHNILCIHFLLWSHAALYFMKIAAVSMCQTMPTSSLLDNHVHLLKSSSLMINIHAIASHNISTFKSIIYLIYSVVLLLAPCAVLLSWLATLNWTQGYALQTEQQHESVKQRHVCWMLPLATPLSPHASIPLHVIQATIWNPMHPKIPWYTHTHTHNASLRVCFT